ncbi:MAG: hypothetical protein ABIJ09_20520 [Pseudomonadota bacterium]
MPRSKGSNVVTVRKLVQAAGVEDALLARLSAADVDTYHATLAVSWVDIEVVARIFAAGAAVLFPGDVRSLRRLGRAIAEDNMRGMYRLILRVISIPFAIGQSARIWGTYNDAGRMTVEREPDQPRLRLVVQDYLDFPDATLEETAGYVEGVALLCGARSAQAEGWREGDRRFGWRVQWAE